LLSDGLQAVFTKHFKETVELRACALKGKSQNPEHINLRSFLDLTLPLNSLAERKKEFIFLAV